MEQWTWITRLIIFYIGYSRLFWVYFKKLGEKITVKIKTGYYLELLTPETIKLLGITKNKIIKKKMVKMHHI